MSKALCDRFSIACVQQVLPRQRGLRRVCGLGLMVAGLAAPAAFSAEPAANVPLAVIGTPLPTVEIGDAKHCPTNVTPTRPAADRMQVSLVAGQPVAITLSAERGGLICGGSVYVTPGDGLIYAARLTPGNACATELFQIDPKTRAAPLLIRSDDHPQLNQLICATQNGPRESSRFSAAGRAGGVTRLELSTAGSCGPFSRVNYKDPSGVELVAGVKVWVQMKFRSFNYSAGVEERTCDLNFAFTPSEGGAYFVDYAADKAGCQVHLLREDEAGVVSPTGLEKLVAPKCP